MARDNYVIIKDNLTLFRIDIRKSFSWICTVAAAEAGAVADKVKISSIVYENATKQGPPLVVLPGQFKMTSQNFSQKISPNNTYCNSFNR